jgi:hypothetical protein
MVIDETMNVYRYGSLAGFALSNTMLESGDHKARDPSRRGGCWSRR